VPYSEQSPRWHTEFSIHKIVISNAFFKREP
jgi:hypothetical protein